jgi:hypothetical protein
VADQAAGFIGVNLGNREILFEQRNARKDPKFSCIFVWFVVKKISEKIQKTSGFRVLALNHSVFWR